MANRRKVLHIKDGNLWYFVGLIASDGCLSKDGRHIDVTSKDQIFLKELKGVLGLNNKIGRKYGSSKKEAFRIQITNKNFYQFLLTIGLTQKKSLTLGAVDVPQEFFVDFLRGLIDGDGCIRSWKHPTNLRQQWSLRIYSGSNKFLEWLGEKTKEYLHASGRVHQYNKHGTENVLKFGKMAARRIIKSCYYDDCFGLRRKIILARDCMNSSCGWKRSKTAIEA